MKDITNKMNKISGPSELKSFSFCNFHGTLIICLHACIVSNAHMQEGVYQDSWTKRKEEIEQDRSRIERLVSLIWGKVWYFISSFNFKGYCIMLLPILVGNFEKKDYKTSWCNCLTWRDYTPRFISLPLSEWIIFTLSGHIGRIGMLHQDLI